ncbi:MAG: hypothetical protein NXI10_07570 [bacterium]|nr:hypothetical protein [bacterium]
MFFLAYIILPALILGNLVLIIVNLADKKIHPISALFFVAVPIVAFIVHWNFFPAERKEGFIVFIRYPEYVLVHSAINAVIFIILKITIRYEKNPTKKLLPCC